MKAVTMALSNDLRIMLVATLPQHRAKYRPRDSRVPSEWAQVRSRPSGKESSIVPRLQPNVAPSDICTTVKQFRYLVLAEPLVAELHAEENTLHFPCLAVEISLLA